MEKQNCVNPEVLVNSIMHQRCDPADKSFRMLWNIKIKRIANKTKLTINTKNIIWGSSTSIGDGLNYNNNSNCYYIMNGQIVLTCLSLYKDKCFINVTNVKVYLDSNVSFCSSMISNF